jgi:hypothetical protein
MALELLGSGGGSGVQLGGDLGGTTAAPTVAKIQGTTISAPPGGSTAFLRGDGTWVAPSGGGTVGPAGATGPAGSSGPTGLNWRGAYSNTTTYAANDAVELNGSAWIATAGTTGVSPNASGDGVTPGTNWNLLAQVGATGPTGTGSTPATVTSTYMPAFVGTSSSGSPTANLLYIERIFIPYAATLSGGVWVNNSATAGNVLVGLYNASGTRVAATASTAAGNGYATAKAAFTAAYNAAAGVYFVGIMASSATEVWSIGYPVDLYATAAQGSFALPATITPPTTYTATGTLIPVVATY